MTSEPIEPTEPVDKDPRSDAVATQVRAVEEAGQVAQAGTDVPATETKVDSVGDDVKARYESMMEGQRLRPLINSIYALYNDRPSDTARTVLDLLNNDKISKKDKHTVIKILVMMITEKFGVIGATGDGKKDWIDTEWLHKFYQMFQEYLKYFEETAEVEWRNEILTRIAAECFKPFNIHTPEDKEPVWRAQRFSERIDLAEEINRTVQVKDIEQERQKGVAAISDIVRQNVSITYYDRTTDNSNRRHEIQTLASRYEIALPSKKEVWEKKIREDIDEVDEKLAEKESELEKGNEVDDLGELRKFIDAIEQILKKASSEIEGLILPEGATSVEEIITGLKDRLSQISTKNLLLRIKRHVQSLEEALASGNEDRINTSIRHFLDTVSSADKKSVNIEEIITTLEELRITEETRIKDLASEIGTDPTSAREKGETLVIRGKVLAKITTAIEDFTKLRPKVA